MKIVKKVGEWLLPDWLRAELRPVLVFTGAGAALCAGSVVLAARGWQWLGERLGTWERLGAIATGGYLTVYGFLHAPHIARFAIPGAVLAWCVTAWCVAPDPADETPDEAPEDDASGPDPQDVADLVRDLVGDDTGVLLTRLRQPLRAADTRAVRELLAAAGIAVRPGVRTAAGNGPGVHRNDLPAPPPPQADPSPNPVVAGGDANTNTTNALRVHSQEGMTIISDPADRHRTHSLKKAP
jgi:hypothetical protein